MYVDLTSDDTLELIQRNVSYISTQDKCYQMNFSQYYAYIRRYLLLLAILLFAFSVFALFASRYLVVNEPYMDVFTKACTFFGTPFTLYSLLRIFAEETPSVSSKARHNICLFLASTSIVIIGIIF